MVNDTANAYLPVSLGKTKYMFFVGHFSKPRDKNNKLLTT